MWILSSRTRFEKSAGIQNINERVKLKFIFSRKWSPINRTCSVKNQKVLTLSFSKLILQDLTSFWFCWCCFNFEIRSNNSRQFNIKTTHFSTKITWHHHLDPFVYLKYILLSNLSVFCVKKRLKTDYQLNCHWCVWKWDSSRYLFWLVTLQMNHRRYASYLT